MLSREIVTGGTEDMKKGREFWEYNVATGIFSYLAGILKLLF